MIELAEPSRTFDHENAFYQTCDTRRLSKLVAHCDLYRKTIGLAGDIVECGVFKGCSFFRWAHFREMFSCAQSHTIIGFDTFGAFPDTNYKPDKIKRDKFLEAAGNEGLSTKQLSSILARKGVDQDIKLVPGDITQTVPHYVKEHPELRISLLNIDTDLYEPAKTILTYLYPKVVSGGIILLDDYGVFPGETHAVDEFLEGSGIKISKLPYARTPSFIIKP